MLRSLTIAIIVATIAPSAQADPSTQVLLDRCRKAKLASSDPHDVADASYCVGYLSGFMGAQEQLLAKPDRKICFPDNATMGQVAEAYVAWGDKNYAKLQQLRSGAVFSALKDAYPCPVR